MLPLASCAAELCSSEEQIEPWIEIVLYCVLGLCVLGVLALLVWCVVEAFKGNL
jgi:hypothetical protein